MTKKPNSRPRQFCTEKEKYDAAEAALERLARPRSVGTYGGRWRLK